MKHRIFFLLLHRFFFKHFERWIIIICCLLAKDRLLLGYCHCYCYGLLYLSCCCCCCCCSVLCALPSFPNERSAYHKRRAFALQILMKIHLAVIFFVVVGSFIHSFICLRLLNFSVLNKPLKLMNERYSWMCVRVREIRFVSAIFFLIHFTEIIMPVWI